MIGLSLKDMRRGLLSGDFTAYELTSAHLDAIRASQSSLHTFISTDEEVTLGQARESDERIRRGAEFIRSLEGIPVAIKDLDETTDFPTSYGCRHFQNHQPTEDSVLVERLRNAGCVFLGKSNTPAYGLLGETKNRLGPDCVNPWDPSRTVGGSSGGSAAAVAAGLTPIATGTDGAGSISSPAGMCGVLGLKGTRGRIPMYPGIGDSGTLHSPGILAHGVEELCAAFNSISGYDARDMLSRKGSDAALTHELQPCEYRVAFSPDLGRFPVDDAVRKSVESFAALLADIGMDVEQVDPPVGDPWDVFWPIYKADSALTLAEFLRPDNPEPFDESRQEFADIFDLKATDLAQAYRERRQMMHSLDTFFEDYDIIVCPANATVPFEVRKPPTIIGGERTDPTWPSYMPFAVAWNVTGLPTLTIPSRPSDQELPIGAMLITRWHEEQRLVSVAARVADAQPWPRAPLPSSGA